MCSSTSSAAPTGQQPSLISSLPLLPMMAGYLSYIPVHRAFVLKNCRQLGENPPKFNFYDNLRGSLKSGMSFSAIVGTQLLAQKKCEEYLAREYKLDKNDIRAKCLSTLGVSLASAPFLAGFNALNSSKPFFRAFFGVCIAPKQCGAIVLQEFGFLSSFVLSKPLSEGMKKQLGDNPLVEATSYLASGFLGGTAGHAGNTFLTLYQNKKKWESWKQLTLGYKQRVPAVMLLTTIFNFSLQGLEHLKNKHLDK